MTNEILVFVKISRNPRTEKLIYEYWPGMMDGITKGKLSCYNKLNWQFDWLNRKIDQVFNRNQKIRVSAVLNVIEYCTL